MERLRDVSPWRDKMLSCFTVFVAGALSVLGVTAFVGAPVLIALARRSKASGL